MLTPAESGSYYIFENGIFRKSNKNLVTYGWSDTQKDLWGSNFYLNGQKLN